MLTIAENFHSRKLSYYKSISQNSFQPITISELANLVLDKVDQPQSLRQSGNWYATLLENDEKRAKQYKAAKMTAYCPTGFYLRAKKDRRMVEPSGLVWIDFDDVENAPVVRNKLGRLSNCVLAYVSVSGKGVHLLLATSVMPKDSDLYGRLWDIVVRCYIHDEFKQYIDPASRRLGQLAIPAVDIEAIVNLVVEVPQILVPKPKPGPNLAQAHRRIGLPNQYKLSSADYAQRQLRVYNLVDRTRPPEDYPTWIRLLASLKSGNVDENSVRSWSQRGSNYHQKSFDRAWKSLSNNGGITIGTFIWWAQSNKR